MKQCSTCGLIKPVTEFSKQAKSKDGLQYSCKVCNKEYGKKYFRANADKITKQQATYRKANADRIVAYRKTNADKIAKQMVAYRKANADKITKQQAEYYEANRDRIAVRGVEYRKANADKIVAYRKANPDYMKEYRKANPDYMKEYREVNADRIAESRIKYREVNADKIAEYESEYHQTPKYKAARARSDAKRRAALDATECTLTVDEWTDVVELYQGLCAYCGVAPGITQDHIIPLVPRQGEPRGTHTQDNVVPACKPCNSSKNNRPVEIWRPGWTSLFGLDGQNLKRAIIVYEANQQ